MYRSVWFHAHEPFVESSTHRLPFTNCISITSRRLSHWALGGSRPDDLTPRLQSRALRAFTSRTSIPWTNYGHEPLSVGQHWLGTALAPSFYASVLLQPLACVPSTVHRSDRISLLGRDWFARRGRRILRRAEPPRVHQVTPHQIALAMVRTDAQSLCSWTTVCASTTKKHTGAMFASVAALVRGSDGMGI